MSPRNADVEPVNWEERLRAAVEDSTRRRRAREAERREFARRRAHGLIDRNAVRLAEARRRRAA
ncbi:hypothetical protein Aab01nite_71730 [Paractinoplanes abujensis]|uniref:Uncharacterized protein n=1 Tax=Paractinoplanes abujensis TaxID=882441 RepID=A0A7W7G3P2_9ACTN|nr:hypothetical protein [Actinoplanes abujensis]MBB4694854.1 hypothetical protein [Actinoplanes abujensis]GID23583.1 hypothetical protein Aab01nite_71730 [Actinoplanes abujensis]